MFLAVEDQEGVVIVPYNTFTRFDSVSAAADGADERFLMYFSAGNERDLGCGMRR
jgi:hypothetical protein